VERIAALLDYPTGRRREVGVIASVVAVAAVTGAIELLKLAVPVLSLGALYIFAVLPVAVVWGTGFGVGVAIASMLAFNWFFLPPVHTFTLADSRNWLALLVFVVTAVVASELAARSRRRATESELLAGIATSLLAHGEVRGELERIASEVARVLAVDRARIELGATGSSDPAAYPLVAGTRHVGVIYLDGPRMRGIAARRRLLPALASLLGVAVDRERLAAEALEAEALRRTDAMKTALLRAVSHDLRSPLMAILTSASALAREDLALDPDDRRELLATISGEAARLDRLVTNLLDLSRLQAGAARPEPDVCAIEDIVGYSLHELGPAGARIDVSLPEQLPPVRADFHQIERALVNLMENALKYSPEDRRVAVRVTATSGEVIVRVIDRGRGIAPSELSTIFQPFERGSSPGAVGGAGLGLAIARGFAEANAGRVWAESRIGQGATFALALPAVKAPVEALT
jgi:two-component system, OmpR family, sensor histidine kinase KdpD